MFNLGMDGDDTLLQQQFSPSDDGFNRPLYDMGADDGEPSPRGEMHTPAIEAFTSHLLRLGYLMQTGALFLMIVFYMGFGGTGLFVFDLYSGPEAVKVSAPFHLVTSLLTALYLLGTLYIGMFQVFVADNSKWTRGFRIGSKLLSSAVALDAISMSLRLIQYLYAYFYMGLAWWSRYNQSKAEWCLFNFGNLINAFALLFYGLALFYLEAYHDDGTLEQFAWVNLTLFTLAAAAELLLVFTGYGAFFTIILLMAMGSATMWALNFEPLLRRVSPDLHSREVNADVLPDDMVSKTGSTTSGAQTGALEPSNILNEMYEAEQTNRQQQPAYSPQQGGYAGQNIPTSYDYSQLAHQVSHGQEMGMVGTPY